MTFIHDFFTKKPIFFFEALKDEKKNHYLRKFDKIIFKWPQKVKICSRIIFWKRMQKSALMLNQYHTRIFLCKVTFSSLSISISSFFFKHIRSNFLLKISYHNSESRVQVIFLKQVKILSLPWKKTCILRQRKKTTRHRTFWFWIANSQV